MAALIAFSSPLAALGKTLKLGRRNAIFWKWGWQPQK